MRIRLIENVGYMLIGSMPVVEDSIARALIANNQAVEFDPHIKDIEKPTKDKMVRNIKRK